jgi:hypothetical protein
MAVKFLFSLYQKYKRKGSDTTTDADPQTRRLGSAQDLFFSAPESSIGSFISLSGNQHPQQTLRKLLFYFGIPDFAIS